MERGLGPVFKRTGFVRAQKGGGECPPEYIHRNGVSDGARTRDNWGHNPVLYQLSYTHHIKL